MKESNLTAYKEKKAIGKLNISPYLKLSLEVQKPE